MHFSKITGIAGIVFVFLVGVFNIVLGASSPPANDASAAEIGSYYTANGGAMVLISVIAPLVWVALLVFGAGVFAKVRGHELGSGEAWGYIGLLGILMQNALFATVVAIDVAFNVGAESLAANAGVTEMLWRFQHAIFTLNGVSLALVLTGFSIAALRAGLIPRWHASVGFVSAALLFASAASVTPAVEGSWAAFIGLPGFLLWLVWILSMGVRLIKAPATASPAVVTA